MRFKLPTNDLDRKKLLENAIIKTVQDATIGTRYVLEQSQIDVTAFIPVFTAAIKLKESELKHRMKEIGEQTDAFITLKTFILDMIQVAKRRIFRMKEPVDNLKYFGMPQTGDVPNPKSMDDISNLAETVITGDADAVADGFPAMANPSAAEVQEKLTAAEKERDEAKMADTILDNAQEDLANKRLTCESWIKEIQEELEFGLRKKDDSSRRRVMRSYGFKFESNNENTPKKAENFKYVFSAPDIEFSCDALAKATGYLIEYSQDGEDWKILYDGDENQYKYAPPVGLRYYRMLGHNEYGDGEWSDIISFDNV
jgi:hypothetical protein